MKKRNGKLVPHIRKVNSGTMCALGCLDYLVDGRDYYMLKCGHYICPECMRKSRRITTEGFAPEGYGGVVVSRLRCSCGKDFGEEEVRAAKKFRANIAGQHYELTDAYVAVKEEPVN